MSGTLLYVPLFTLLFIVPLKWVERREVAEGDEGLAKSLHPVLKENSTTDVSEKAVSTASVLFLLLWLKHRDKNDLRDKGSILAQSSRV